MASSSAKATHRMKFCILCAVVLIAGVLHSKSTGQFALQRYQVKCSSKYLISDYDATLIMNGNVPTTEQGKCFMQCVMTAFGWIENDAFIKENIIQCARELLNSNPLQYRFAEGVLNRCCMQERNENAANPVEMVLCVKRHCSSGLPLPLFGAWVPRRQINCLRTSNEDDPNGSTTTLTPLTENDVTEKMSTTSCSGSPDTESTSVSTESSTSSSAVLTTEGRSKTSTAKDHDNYKRSTTASSQNGSTTDPSPTQTTDETNNNGTECK